MSAPLLQAKIPNGTFTLTSTRKQRRTLTLASGRIFWAPRLSEVDWFSIAKHLLDAVNKTEEDNEPAANEPKPEVAS